MGFLIKRFLGMESVQAFRSWRISASRPEPHPLPLALNAEPWLVRTGAEREKWLHLEDRSTQPTSTDHRPSLPHHCILLISSHRILLLWEMEVQFLLLGAMPVSVAPHICLVYAEEKWSQFSVSWGASWFGSLNRPESISRITAPEQCSV